MNNIKRYNKIAILIDKGLHTKFKKYCKDHALKIGDFTETLIKKELEKEEKINE